LRRRTGEALVEAALEEVRLLESLDFHDFKISVKSSHVPTMIRAYRLLSEKVPYPLHSCHRGGTPFAGSINPRSAWARCSPTALATRCASRLTADPVEEIKTAFEILKGARPARARPVMIACPSCGRDK